MAKVEMVVTVRVAWWFLWLYCPGVVLVTLFCRLFICPWAEPDWDKVNAVARRAVHVYVNGRKCARLEL
jgi:hypothetical protein